MTKERFVELINFIDKKRNQENELCGVLETICPDEYVNAFIFSEYETELVNLLKDTLNIPEDNDILEYFLYDLDFGRDYSENIINADISSAEKLYDYLKENY